MSGFLARCLSTEAIVLAFVSLFYLSPQRLQAQIVRTGYTSVVASNSAKCLDIAGESTSLGIPAVQLACNSSANQQWTVQNYNGSFRLIQQQTGNCLVISGNSTTPGAQLVPEPCSGIPAELWSFTANGGSFQMLSKLSGLCASVSSDSLTDSADIIQQTCSTAANFLWTFSSGLFTSSTLSVLQAAHSGQCLQVSGAGTTSGVAIDQNPCTTSTSQQWTLTASGGFFELVAHNSLLCLSNAGSNASGAGIVQSACSSTASSGDLWTLTPVSGSYEVVSDNSGLCLTVPGSTQTPGTALIQSACTAALDQLWSMSAAAIPSSWTAVTQLAVDPIAVANLTNGNLIMWSANDQYTYQGDIGYGAGQTYSAVFNPSTMVSTSVLVTNTGDDMFCPGTANLFNGNILVNGGDSSPKTTIYNPATGLWSSDADMNVPRGYEGDTVLTNGSVFTLGGSWSGGVGGKTAEVWTQGIGWTLLPGIPETNIIGPDPLGIYRGDNHLWLFSAPNGLVFHAGPSAAMHWIDPSGTGTITSAGNRGDDIYSINGSTVLYDVGMIMKAGGASAYDNGTAEANAYVININNGVSGVAVTKIAPMAYPRAFSNGVVLPNGQVVIIGGQTLAEPFSDATAVLTPEIWDPQTQAFRQLNPMQTPRVYHSTGILLSDGRVYEGGGGQCGEGCSANHFNTEILTPPYLLNADGSAATRPVITSASTAVSLGGTISATTASPVVSFVLMRLSSVTHTVNNDQRRIPLQMQFANGTTYVLTVPSNPGIVLPGNYWLFALNAQGVPSLASNVLVSPNSGPGFSIGAAQPSVFAIQGGQTSVSITEAGLNGFSGSVTLSASGLPTGVTASFGTNPTSGSSLLTLTAGSSAAAGTYNITVNGVSSSLTASTIVSLIVGSNKCTTSGITPYLQVNGAAWQQTATATVAAGSIVNLGPQPFGTWFWTGPGGFTFTQRQIVGVPLSPGANTFASTYVDGNYCSSTQNFVITVPSTGGSFTIAPTTPTVPVNQGSSATDTITVTDTGGFTGSVTLSASGLPTGVTASFGTNPTTGSSLLTLTAATSTVAGTYNITVTGVSGSLTSSTGISLIVGSTNCTPSPITPYLQVNGAAWQQTATATVASGAVVNLGPQPFGTTWSWTGPAGFTSTQREIDGIPLTTGTNTFTSTFVNASSCSSTQIFVITVTSAGGSFTIAPTAPSLSVTQGSSGTDTISVTDVGGFTGSVTLSASGLPTGVTALFGTNPTTGSSLLTLTAATSTVPGTYNLTITGVSASLTASTPISLTVNSSTCTPTPITPYLQVNGAAWLQTATATVAAGSVVNLGPQPFGTTWSWTGPAGFTSTLREIDGIPLATGTNTFTGTFINANSCASTQTFVITVPAAGGTFTIAPSAATLPVSQGGKVTDTISVTDIGGFTGSVTLSASGLPTGVTASFATNPTTGSSVLTIAAGSATVAGTYNITVTGVSNNLNASTAILLVVGISNCTPAAITPYVQVNGAAWQQSATATVAAGSTVNLGPQPFGTWYWSGPAGFSSTLREIDGIPLSEGANTYRGIYVNPNSCLSTQNFVITVQ